MFSPNRPLSGSNRPGTPLRPSAVSGHYCLAAPAVSTVAPLPISFLSRTLYSLCTSLCHPAPCPVAFSVPTFTCLPSRGLPDKKLQNVSPHLFFKNRYKCSLGFIKINSDAQSVNMYGARLRIRAFVDIDRSAKQFVLANVTMIYHYHIFVGKSIKSMGLPVEQD